MTYASNPTPPIPLASASPNSTKDIQSEIFKILKYFHEFCEESDIKYYIIGGTLLGAVRHGGFIPWDDDIDIGIPRADYEKLITLSKKISPPFLLESYDLNPDNYFPFLKLYNSSTLALEDVINPMQRGVWVDIFPLDGTFKNSTLAAFHIKAISMLKKLIAYQANGYSEKGKRKFKIYFLKILAILLKTIPKSIFHKLIGKLLRAKGFHSSYRVGNLLGYWGIGEIVKPETLGKPALINFETTQVYAPGNPHVYLRSIYGDYMKLPPIEKRYGHKFQHLDLKNSSKTPSLH